MIILILLIILVLLIRVQLISDCVETNVNVLANVPCWHWGWWMKLLRILFLLLLSLVLLTTITIFYFDIFLLLTLTINLLMTLTKGKWILRSSLWQRLAHNYILPPFDILLLFLQMLVLTHCHRIAISISSVNDILWLSLLDDVRAICY